MTSGQTKRNFAPESSPEDAREYRWCWLPNGLPALLVHIPEAEQAAAAIAVRAGHFQDPRGIAGLAHFLEHMLFLGSEAYPDAESYSDFISYSGGHHNAWTGTEHSNFYLELPIQFFDEGLGRFSSLFTAPLFAPDWIEKERQAVEAEYRMKVKDELRRLYDVHKETSNPAHPFAQFSVGNAETLADTEIPLRTRLQDFFATYYHAGNMALTLAGPQSINELEQLATKHFSQLAQAKEPTPTPTVPLYESAQLGQWIEVQPLKEANRLLLTFPLPSINEDYLCKTTSFIAHLLGYEGQDSLCAALRRKGWIQNLSAGGGASGSNFKDFNINIQLTDLGRKHMHEVIQACFTYIRLIREQGLDEQLYLERQRMVGLAFLFPETLRPVDLASQLAINMLHYSPEHVVSGDYRMDGLNLAFANQLLAHMTPANMRVTVIHPEAKVERVSKWYQAHYSMRPISGDEQEFYLAPWSAAPLKISPANPYIPDRKLALPLEHEPEQRVFPRHYNASAALDLWHLQDAQFRVPKGHLYLMLKMPFANASARNYACSRIWCELGLELLNERFYDAEVAGIHFNLYPQHGGITLHIAGFSCRQEQLFADLVQTLGSMNPAQATFEMIKRQLESSWLSVHKNNPINHLFAMLHHHLQQGAFTSKQLAESVADLDYSHFINLLPGLFRDAQATLLVHGDWTLSQAQTMAAIATKELPLTEAPTTRTGRYVRRLPPGIEQSRFASSHPDHATAFFLQGEDTSLEEKAVFLLLNHFAGPEFFSELRTRQQLGYLVGSSYVPMHGLPGLLFYVQSPQTTPDELTTAIRAFLQDFVTRLPDLTAEQWQQALRAVAHHLRDHDPSLRIRAQRFWQTLTNNQGDFTLARRLAETIEALTFDHFLDRAQHYLTGQLTGMELSTSALTDQP
ncbi:MAG: insulinase family protein [Idiomarina sp.]|nr:insulinase family protein [Idiomarina sp.]